MRPPLSSARELILHTLLAGATGILAGAVSLTFRYAVESSQARFLPGGLVGNYEALERPLRLALPVAGALLLGLAFHWLSAERRRVGVVHVLDCFAYHGGRLPLANAVVQFFAGSLALVSGQSVDREGPGVHLGAAGGSLLGQALGLPDTTLRVLVACGSAAAIAAAFNTPLAGVVFAIEVVVAEYSIGNFAPVILASVIGAVLSRTVYGPDPAFAIPTIGLSSLLELPLMVVLGISAGLLAVAFITLCERTAATTWDWPVMLRFVQAGLVTGVCALWVPEIMSLSYDTTERILRGQVGLWPLLQIAGCKLLATGVAIGMGIPGGLIGPTLVIGAATGAAWGLLADVLFPAQASFPAFYAMVGMGAMMSATLRAPLAALTALLELTADPHVILPAMLAVAPANLMVSSLHGRESVFRALLERSGPHGRGG